jgi:putative tricarboxylic transport membrane protein
MKHAQRTVAVIFAALSVYVIEQALRLGVYSSIGPGAGFFPLFLGGIFGGLTVLWVILEVVPLQPGAATFFPSGASTLRVVAVLAALLFWIFSAEWLGFTITTFLFLGFLLAVLAKSRLTLAVPLAAVASIGSSYVFQHWLNVALPVSAFDFLRTLGL